MKKCICGEKEAINKYGQNSECQSHVSPSQWKIASENKPTSLGNLLVSFLEPAFGKLSIEVTVAYYDEYSKKWLQSPSGRVLYHVSHWTELPNNPDIDLDKLSQGALCEDDYTVNLEKSYKAHKGD